MKIKRTKTGPPGPDDLPPTTSVHWARKIDEATATIAEWTRDEAQAVDFDDTLVGKVLGQYAGRRNVGKLEAVMTYGGDDAPPEPALPPAPDGPRSTTDELHAAVAEINRLRGVLDLRQDEIVGLHGKNDHLQAENAALKVEVASLKEMLEQATAPALPTPPKKGPGRPPKVKQPEATTEEGPTTATTTEN